MKCKEVPMLFFLFALSGIRVALSEGKFKYRFEYASFVQEAQNHSESPLTTADLHVCQLSAEEKLKICQEAIKQPRLNLSDVRLVYEPQVYEQKVYAFSLTGEPNLGKPPLVTTACMCSTSSPIYLRDNSSGNYIDVYYSFRELYVKHVIDSPDFAFKFEHVVYAKSTLAPVKPYNTKLRICGMKEEEKLQMCRSMLADPFCENYGVEYTEGYGPPVLEERMYEIKLADFEHTFSPPLFKPACMCPTKPSTYIACMYTGKVLDIYVVLRDELLLSEGQ